MRFQLARRVGVLVEIVPVRLAVAEQAMHHRAGERAVGAGLHHHREIGLLHRAVHVDVDRDDLGAALLAGAGRVRHHVDLGVHRIGAPDHDQIGFRHLARIGTGDAAGAGGKAGVGGVDADGGMEAASISWRGAGGGCRRAARGPWCRRSSTARPTARRSALRPRGTSRRRCRARRPRRSAQTGPSPSARSAASAASAGRDGGCARRSARPWRRSRPRCRRCPARRAPGRWCGRRAPRPRARRSKGNRADRRSGRSA